MKQHVKWLPSVITILGLLASLLDPTVQHFWATHQDLAYSVAGVWPIITHFMPPPHK